MTGEIATDPSDAAGTGMLDVHTRDWSDLMLETVGLDRGKVPAIRPSAQIVGRLTSDAASTWDCRPDSGSRPAVAMLRSRPSRQALLMAGRCWRR